jgi:hypothetical protein
MFRSSLHRLNRILRVEYVPPTRCSRNLVQLFTDFCHNVTTDQDTESAFQLAAYELIENLAKYSTNDPVIAQIEVQTAPVGARIVFTTQNRTTPQRLHDVDTRLTAAETAEDPCAHFDRLVQESLTLPPGESRLGLGRLRFEGDLELCHRIEGNTVLIEVSRRVFHVTVPDEAPVVYATAPIR